MGLRKTGQTVGIERARSGKIIFNNKNSVLDCVVICETLEKSLFEISVATQPRRVPQR